MFGQYQSLDQYRGELGVTGGTSFYLGDANPSKLFYGSGSAFGIMGRYNLNPRYSLKLCLMNAEVSGNTADFPNKFPEGQNASFSRNFWDLGLDLEFNFLDYGLPKYDRENSWFSPYIFLGGGITSYQDQVNDLSQLTFNFPFGLGVKFKVFSNVNAGFEWSLHNLFIDDFDVVDKNSELLNNPYGVKNNTSKNNDKYSIANVFITIDLSQRKYCK
jgi:opacity protein-like surface antigen